MKPLPTPHAAFEAKKAKLLSQLSIPDADYTDASPKGSVDEGIRDLIDEINTRDGLVTTSSCAGRVSVFVEGSKGSKTSAEDAESDKSKPASAVGGKGGGGAWLFVSHDPIDESVLNEDEDVAALFGLEAHGKTVSAREPDAGSEPSRLIHFKFEPMVKSCSPLLSVFVRLRLIHQIDPPHPNSLNTTRPARPEVRSPSRLP